MKRAPIAVAGIQARMGSRRLPGKSLVDLAGVPMVQRVYERVRMSTRVGAVVVLTSSDPSDDPLVEHCARAGLACLRGPLDDVLARYLALLEQHPMRYLVRVTGDCPLVAPEYIDLQLDALLAHDADFAVPRGDPPCAPLAGMGALSSRALWWAGGSTDALDREHVGSFFFARHRGDFRTVELDVDPLYLRAAPRLSVDEADDLALVRCIFEHFAPGWGSGVPLCDVLRWLDEHAELAAQNRGVHPSAANESLARLLAAAPPRVVGTWP